MEDVLLDFKGEIVAGEQVEQSQEAAQAMYDFWVEPEQRKKIK